MHHGRVEMSKRRVSSVTGDVQTSKAKEGKVVDRSVVVLSVWKVGTRHKDTETAADGRWQTVEQRWCEGGRGRDVAVAGFAGQKRNEWYARAEDDQVANCLLARPNLRSAGPGRGKAKLVARAKLLPTTKMRANEGWRRTAPRELSSPKPR